MTFQFRSQDEDLSRRGSSQPRFEVVGLGRIDGQESDARVQFCLRRIFGIGDDLPKLGVGPAVVVRHLSRDRSDLLGVDRHEPLDEPGSKPSILRVYLPSPEVQAHDCEYCRNSRKRDPRSPLNWPGAVSCAAPPRSNLRRESKL